MMEPVEVSAITRAMERFTYEEWCQLRDRIEEEFEARRKRVTLTGEGGAAVRRTIAVENEWPLEAETPQQAQQTQMGI